MQVRFRYLDFLASLSVLRRAHDHHRQLRAGLNAMSLADRSNDLDQNSTPHDIAQTAISQTRLFHQLVPHRPRRRLLEYPNSSSIRAAIFFDQGAPPLTSARDRRLPSRCNAQPPTSPFICGAQIPIARRTAASYLPRFPPLEVFRRRPPLHAALSVSGRRPKTFTKSELAGLPRRVRSSTNTRHLA